MQLQMSPGKLALAPILILHMFTALQEEEDTSLG